MSKEEFVNRVMKDIAKRRKWKDKEYENYKYNTILKAKKRAK